MAYDVTSQWDDIHRKLGNYEELPVEKKQFEHTKEANHLMDGYNPFDNKDEKDLEDIEDELDDDFLRMFKAERMAEIGTSTKAPTWGWVKEISKPDFKREVNEAPAGVFVCLLLYQEYIESCQLMLKVIEEAAKKYEHIKFLKSVATKTIENYKDN